MRSIIASNPIESARESLKVMLDENRKKYENAQRKYDATAPDQSKSTATRDPFDGPLRREVWIHPEGGRRIYRTAPLNQPAQSAELSPTDRAAQQLHDELCAMDQDEVSVPAINYRLFKVVTCTFTN